MIKNSARASNQNVRGIAAMGTGLKKATTAANPPDLMLNSGTRLKAHPLSGGAGGVTGAVAGAGVALGAALNVGVGGRGHGIHCHLGLGVHALAADPGACDSLSILQVHVACDIRPVTSCC